MFATSDMKEERTCLNLDLYLNLGLRAVPQLPAGNFFSHNELVTHQNGSDIFQQSFLVFRANATNNN